MKEILVVCPTSKQYRDLREIELNHKLIFEELCINDIHAALSANFKEQPIPDLISALENAIDKYRYRNLAGVVSTHGYPGMCVTSIMAKKFGLPGPSPQAVFTCLHKYYARLSQQKLVAEATPAFQLIDPQKPDTIFGISGFPYFLKPVRSTFSVNASKVNSTIDLRDSLNCSIPSPNYLKPFNDLLRTYTDFPLDGSYLLLEELLEGQQVTLEGYVYDNRVTIMGIVDSIMFPGTISFKQFQYPSSLPYDVQLKMEEIAKTYLTGIGFNNGMFNIEFMYNPNAKISIIEINPRMASQFCDLYEKVDGINSYQILLKLALGQDPKFSRGNGRFKLAASCVLRTFSDQQVISTPEAESIQKVCDRYPDALIDIRTKSGRKLSDQMQDKGSYRYGLINIGAQTQQELDDKFKQCKRMLPFVFMPVSNRCTA